MAGIDKMRRAPYELYDALEFFKAHAPLEYYKKPVLEYSVKTLMSYLLSLGLEERRKIDKDSWADYNNRVEAAQIQIAALLKKTDELSFLLFLQYF